MSTVEVFSYQHIEIQIRAYLLLLKIIILVHIIIFFKKKVQSHTQYSGKLDFYCMIMMERTFICFIFIEEKRKQPIQQTYNFGKIELGLLTTNFSASGVYKGNMESHDKQFGVMRNMLKNNHRCRIGPQLQ